VGGNVVFIRSKVGVATKQIVPRAVVIFVATAICCRRSRLCWPRVTILIASVARQCIAFTTTSVAGYRAALAEATVIDNVVVAVLVREEEGTYVGTSTAITLFSIFKAFAIETTCTRRTGTYAITRKF
jgi:hypothetical protein